MLSQSSPSVAATSRGTFESAPPSLRPADAVFRHGVQGHARPDVLSVHQASAKSMPLEPALADLRPSKPSLVPGQARRFAYDVDTTSPTERPQHTRTMTHAL